MPTVNKHKQRIDSLKATIKQEVEKIVSIYIGQKVSKLVVEDIRKRVSSHLIERCVIGVTVTFKLRITKTGIIKTLKPTVVGQPAIDPLLPNLVKNLNKEDSKLKAAIDHDGTIHYAWNNDCLMTGRTRQVQETVDVDKEAGYKWQRYAPLNNVSEIGKRTLHNPNTLKKRNIGWQKWIIAICAFLWALLPHERTKVHGGYVSKQNKKEVRRYGRYLAKVARQRDWAHLAGVASNSKDEKRRWWAFFCPWKYG